MSKKLAIAMFGQKRLSREGGVEIVVKELCTRMAQNGCDVTCYNRAGHHVRVQNMTMLVKRSTRESVRSLFRLLNGVDLLQSAPPHLRHFIVHLENTMWCTSTPKDRRSLHGCRRCLGKELLLPSMEPVK